MPAKLRLKGSPLAPGIGVGRACFYCPGEAAPAHEPASGVRERERLFQALAAVTEQLGGLARDADAKLGEELGDIFRAQRMMLNDSALTQAFLAALELPGATAEATVAAGLGAYQKALRAMDAHFSERAADLAELQHRLLERLATAAPYLRCRDSAHCGVGECRLGHDHVLVATRLTAGITIEADPHTVGFLVESGGPSSHAAILAKALGLPAVSGLRDLKSALPAASQILIDGYTGEVIVDPSPEILAKHRTQLPRGSQQLKVATPVPQLRVMADIERVANVAQALRAQAEGIGLYRTEIEALASGRLLSEAEQTARYAQLLDSLPGPVYVRLLDLGSDKSADWLNLPPEENPALGLRGARLLLARPELLRVQARALARASTRRPLHVVYPMIVGEAQYLKLRSLFDQAIADLRGAQLLHGVMFEVPSACMEAEQLFRHIDFARIGANDLVQYLFAADRTNAGIDQDELLAAPAFWRLVEELAGVAARCNKPLSLCGEIAGNPRWIARILRAGIREVSTNPRRIAAVRRAALSSR
ncbi:MAG: putative PEP-binding protein [Gammaproteobacteria bacterium]